MACSAAVASVSDQWITLKRYSRLKNSISGGSESLWHHRLHYRSGRPQFFALFGGRKEGPGEGEVHRDCQCASGAGGACRPGRAQPGGSSVGCRSSGHGARGKEPRVRFPPWAIFSEGERGWVDWPEPAPRGSWIIAELCKWKIDSLGWAAT